MDQTTVLKGLGMKRFHVNWAFGIEVESNLTVEAVFTRVECVLQELLAAEDMVDGPMDSTVATNLKDMIVEFSMDVFADDISAAETKSLRHIECALQRGPKDLLLHVLDLDHSVALVSH